MAPGEHAVSELVSDRTAKTPLDAAAIKRIHEATYQAGAMVRIALNNIVMSPPLVITEAEVDALLSALDAGLAAV